ncbi:hypothetical protein J6TS1_39720 [Siminovitchia terrae]|uniref:Uncharacterized protein n=1 Tax=Siminovitchia terrae TaxID=1914933 RepID=A0ABQ4L1E5_SIMTE|nr:hypothetical protein [Siminovitchia terrae]GIN98102.1 hypothetical protein J6TS1_39720 [Siminovitchia terrae]
MKTVEISEIKDFKKKYQDMKKKGEGLEFLKSGYRINSEEFHKLFLHSAISMGIDQKELKELLSFLRIMPLKENFEILGDIEFIIHLRTKMDSYDNKIENIYLKCEKKIEVEELFNYLEYIKYKMIKEDLSLDNEVYSKEILESQFNHILDSFPEILEVIKNNNLRLALKEPASVKRESKEIFEAVGFKAILRSFFLRLSVEHIKAVKEENYKLDGDTTARTIFFTPHKLPYWSKLERYRELNFYFQDKNIINNEEKINLMIKKQFMTSYVEGQSIKFDFAKGNEWISEKSIRSAYNLLIPIYGNEKRRFKHKESSIEYSIEDLLTVYSSIYKLAIEIEESTYNDKNKKGFIKIYGEKQLMRCLGISLEQKTLLQLLSYDLNNEKISSHIVNHKPLIRSGKVYYILPSWIKSRIHEKVIDKIFLSDIIQFQLDDQTSKGYLFEDSIETIFKSLDIQFNKLERDEDNGLPEIDGMFVLGEYLFIFEAKATVKPDNIVEAYHNLQGPIYKAFNQLKERIKTFLFNTTAQKLIKQKTGIDVSKKIIAPFILLNHHFFNGYQELCLIYQNKKHRIPIIDFFTFKDIIKSKSVPIWKYNENNKCYSRLEVPFENFDSGKELYLYLLNQVNRGIPIEEKPAFQLLEDGILYPIVKPINFL